MMPLRTLLTTPLTPAQHSKIKLLLALLPACCWCLFAWTSFALHIDTQGPIDRSGHIKGHDFAHFYVLAEIGAEHATSDLYDFQAQSARMDRIAPPLRDRFLPVYPPQLAVVLAPLGRLPYVTALSLWWIASALVYAACCIALYRTSAVRQVNAFLFAILAVSLRGFYDVMVAGHTTAFAVGLFVAGWFAIRSSRWFLAGLILGGLAYKPSLAIVIGVIFLVSGPARVVGGMLVSVALQAAMSAAWFGSGALWAFLANARTLTGQVRLLEPQPWQMYSLRAFFSLLLPWPQAALVAYVLSAFVILWIALRAWRSQAPLTVRYAILLFATLLVDPHVNSYDLVLLAPAFALVADAMLEFKASTPRLLILLTLCYYLPLVETVTKFTHFQLFVPTLVLLLVTLARHPPGFQTELSARSQN